MLPAAASKSQLHSNARLAQFSLSCAFSCFYSLARCAPKSSRSCNQFEHLYDRLSGIVAHHGCSIHAPSILGDAKFKMAAQTKILSHRTLARHLCRLHFAASSYTQRRRVAPVSRLLDIRLTFTGVLRGETYFTIASTLLGFLLITFNQASP